MAVNQWRRREGECNAVTCGRREKIGIKNGVGVYNYAIKDF